MSASPRLRRPRGVTALAVAAALVALALLPAVSAVTAAGLSGPLGPLGPLGSFQAALAAQETMREGAPPRGADEGEGPFERLIIRGVTVVDGTGAPARGPMDIVIEDDRIVSVRSVGNAGVPIDPDGRPEGATREIDAEGWYALPGFVDLHAHIRAPGEAQGHPEYVYKLWLAHGVTTIRDPGSGSGVAWTIRDRDRAARNEIVAPTIYAYVRPGRGWDGGAIDSPEQARAWVRWLAEQGGDGLKLTAHEPDVMAALIDESIANGLGTQAHLAQMGVSDMNVLDAAKLGLGSQEHYYGLPELLMEGKTVQDFPGDYNYNDESDRFGWAGRIWAETAEPGSEHWNVMMDSLLATGIVLSPTMTVYEASRDIMRARNADWHEEYTLPSLREHFQPNREAHGSYFYDWSTADEIAWKEGFRKWMAFLDEYKNRGGQVGTGSDSGNIYKVYGFDYIRELELLQEAGFHPLEVVRAATRVGAETLAAPRGEKPDFGTIKPGMQADIVLTEHNPLDNFKVLYGTGTEMLNDETGAVERVGGVRYTIKDGIVYDAQRLLADVREMVRQAKREAATEAGGGGR